MTEDHALKVLSGRKWSPAQLETFLKIYYLVDYFPTQGSLVEKDAVNYFESLGMVELDHRSGEPAVRFKLTQRGNAFLAVLLNTPVPVEGYLDPRTNSVIDVGGCLNA